MADIWDAAIEEARASASIDQFEVEGVEITHPAWVGEDGLPGALRMVLDERDWNLTLEADAPLHAGQTVPFQPTAMRIVRPEQIEGQVGEVRLAFDFVARSVLPWIDDALSLRADGVLRLRTWLARRNLATGVWSVSGPPLEVLKGLIVREIHATATSIEVTAAFKDLVNVGFPRRRFVQGEFPGLF